MERVIASASRTALFGAVSRACGYAGDHVGMCCSVAGLACIAVYISCENLWSAALHHAGTALLLSLPVVLVAWLVIEAEKARQLFRPTRTCRRQ